MVVIEQTEVENMISAVKIEFITKFGNNVSYCFASNSKKSSWDCAIWGINRVSDGTWKFCWLMYMVGNGPDAYDYAKEQFKIQYKDILYDFQNIKHRIFIGQTMAKWLRANK